MAQTLAAPKLFPPLMDRANVLHKCSHTHVVWRKIIPVQNKFVNPEHLQNPQQNSTHCSRQATFQICQLRLEIIPRAQQKPSLRVTAGARFAFAKLIF